MTPLQQAEAKLGAYRSEVSREPHKAMPLYEAWLELCVNVERRALARGEA